MRNLLILLFAAIITVSCTKRTTEIYYIENVTVEFSAKSVFNVEQDDLFTRSAHVHQYPETYKAYFISKENKGDYVVGQLVTTIDVKAGVQNITVPKLDYTVYVTNYEQSEAWYTWSSAVKQLPQGSDVLYLYGKNDINYSTATTGEVEVQNPYAAVFIKNDSHITEAPVHYSGESNNTYKLTEDDWYLKYIRNSTVNTGVKIKFASESHVRNITINDAIEPNKVYRYTLNTEVDSTDTEGNFNVTVEEFSEFIDREINLL